MQELIAFAVAFLVLGVASAEAIALLAGGVAPDTYRNIVLGWWWMLPLQLWKSITGRE